ncbi:amino acid permease [Mycobacterium vulneris]|uniref:APC family permease n=1 Tax=Mycolicibacterium porcinum TaxID=39693 RepID=A0AAW5T3H0_9MYCO|nr:APC family permease [Mycolicibacterium porcinum]MBX8687054.1 amino acid permease [Mycobacterium sp. 20091114027_K0903767]OCB50351.1 amino acid permease [Mycolicibacterium vulneris]MCV7389121.1 APC family permease [Mycolicibacterium porcinum]OCB58343.1 amino acid permease [Mycolicibacterium vulneris]OCB60911.1 amino acid permease [Mycolicibacterium vulneris]
MTEVVNAGHTPAPETSSAGRPAKLRGRLGVPAIVLMVVAASAPLSTIGGNVPIAMALGNTTGIPVAFIVAGVIFGLFAASFVAMSKYVTDAGAFYAYIRESLGRAAGTGAAVLALPAYMATLIAVAAYDGVILNELITRFGGPDIPWWLLTGLVLAAVAWLGYRDIDLSAKVLGVFLVSEVAILMVVDLVIVVRGGEHGLTGDSFTPQGIAGGFGIALLYALWGFVGVEATAVFRDEAKDPDRTVPRATYWAVGIVAVFYAFTSWALVEGNGGHDAIQLATDDPDNFMVNTAGKYLGMVGRDLNTVLWAVSVFACALAFHNIASRYAFVLGQSGVFSTKIGKVHERHGSPSNASLAITVASFVVMGICAALQLDPVLQIFGPGGGLGILALALLWLLTTISVVIFFVRRGNSTGKVVLASFATLALAAALVLVVSNLTLVVGGTPTLAAIFGVMPLVFFAVGMLLSRRSSGELASLSSAG